MVRIDAGLEHACALLGNGSIVCWGHNDHGQLGDLSMIQRNASVAVKNLPGPASAIAAGGNHTCALVDRVAWCWGDHVRGQLGIGTLSRSLTPIDVAFPEMTPDRLSHLCTRCDRYS